MTRNEPSAVARDLRILLDAGGLGGLSDGQLVGRFLDRREAAGAAFEVLVGRHGPMVWGVCRRLLADPHDAADAFQATFLVLVRKAGSVRVDDSLGPWLHGVSLKVARRARSTAARRSARERPGVESIAGRGPDPDRAERLAGLDEEIARLPERYRSAVVLCDLGDLSHQEAARQLGCAVGTVGSRLSRGRERLRGRMTRRGLAPQAGLFTLGLSARPAPSTARVASTTGAALQLAAGNSAPAWAYASLFSKGFLQAMFTTRMMQVAAVALLATTGLITLSSARPAPLPVQVPPAQAPPAPPAAPVPLVDGSPEAILARMLKTYADAPSYEDEGEAVLVFRGDGPKRTVKRPFSTRFVRPKLFRYEFSERARDGDDERNRYVIWTDAAPELSKAWWTIKPEVREGTLDSALGTAAGVSGGTSTIVPGLLMSRVMPSRASLGWLKQPKLTGEEVVEGANCDKIEGLNSSGRPETTWVDKETHLLKKMYEETKIPGAVVEQTTTFRPRLDIAIPADQFDFKPPQP